MIDFFLSNNLELGFDGGSDFPRHLLQVGRVCELVGSGLLGNIEPVEEQIEPDHYKCLKERYYKSLDEKFVNNPSIKLSLISNNSLVNQSQIFLPYLLLTPPICN